MRSNDLGELREPFALTARRPQIIAKRPCRADRHDGKERQQCQPRTVFQQKSCGMTHDLPPPSPAWFLRSATAAFNDSLQFSVHVLERAVAEPLSRTNIDRS